MGVPEGISFSILAGLLPDRGVYTSVFPAAFYVFFGTSRHSAIGTYALTTLLVGFCVKTWAPFDYEEYHGTLDDTTFTNFTDSEPFRPFRGRNRLPRGDILVVPDDPEIGAS